MKLSELKGAEGSRLLAMVTKVKKLDQEHHVQDLKADKCLYIEDCLREVLRNQIV